MYLLTAGFKFVPRKYNLKDTNKGKTQVRVNCKRKAKSVPGTDVDLATYQPLHTFVFYRRGNVPLGGALQQRPLSCTALCRHTARLQSYYGRQRSRKPSEVSVSRHSQR